jgi:hypothetical protein
MRFDSMRIAASLGLMSLGIAFSIAHISPVLAQGADTKATDQRQTGGDAAKQGGQKAIDEFADLERTPGGPAGSPECAWLGWRVLNRLYSDDLDTAFRYLDLYDRFGCPAGHIQIAFRCVVHPGDMDPKARDVIDKRVKACWKNPNTDPVITPPAAASTTPPSQAQ